MTVEIRRVNCLYCHSFPKAARFLLQMRQNRDELLAGLSLVEVPNRNKQEGDGKKGSTGEVKRI